MTLGPVRRSGGGLVAATSGTVVLRDALDLCEQVVVADPPASFVVIDVSEADVVDFSLADVHELARRIHGSSELRGQRHAFVGKSRSARSHVAEYDFMVTEMMNWWGNDPVEVAAFDSLDSAIEWGTTGIHTSED